VKGGATGARRTRRFLVSVWLIVMRASELCFCYVLGLLHVGAAAAAAVAGLGARTGLVGWLGSCFDEGWRRRRGRLCLLLLIFPLRDPREAARYIALHRLGGLWVGRERLGITMTGWRKRTTARGEGAPRCRRTKATRSLHGIA
jgi:hypothetical protein